jgi:hypothetical protein
VTALFDADWRTSYPLDRITRLTDLGKTDHSRQYAVSLKGEQSSVTIGEHARDRIVSHPLQLMPAQPGTYALHPYDDEGTLKIGKTPLIAWALCFDGSIRIVTPQGVDDGHAWKEGQGYVLMPDGTVQAVTEYLDYISFDTLDEYLAHEVAERAARETQA